MIIWQQSVKRKGSTGRIVIRYVEAQRFVPHKRRKVLRLYGEGFVGEGSHAFPLRIKEKDNDKNRAYVDTPLHFIYFLSLINSTNIKIL